MYLDAFKGPMPRPEGSTSSPSTPKTRALKSSTLLQRVQIFAIALIIYVIHHTSVMHRSSKLSLDHDSSIFIPFINKFSPQHVPQVMCTVEGVDIWMPVDTGSTGLLIGAPILPNISSSTGTPAHHYFTSSRILYVGRLVELPLSFQGEAGSYATGKVPVLVVDKSWRCPWYVPSRDGFNCPSGPNGEKPIERDVSKITYMGIGFGRNLPKDGMSWASPSANPFLNIDAIDGLPVNQTSLRPGYTISTHGVHIGLTKYNTEGFVFEKLNPGLKHHEDPRDWAMARMCFSINGEGHHCGPSLVDTGIAQMYIRAEEGFSIPNITIRNPNKTGMAKTVRRVIPGTQIEVGFPSLTNPNMSYSFVVGEGSVIEPTFVRPAKSSSPAYINTGRNFLFGCSIAFDAFAGRFGFRPVVPNTSSLL